jgi:type I restriction enzyme S subunit
LEDESKTLNRNGDFKTNWQINPGDFLISRANTIELVGACVIVRSVTRSLMLSDKVLRLHMPNEWKEWLLLFLRSSAGRFQIESLATGNQLSMRNISQENLRRIVVPLPPSVERDRIVEKVEQLLACVNVSRERLAHVPAILKLFRQAILAAACSGRLTTDWRELHPQTKTAALLLDRIRQSHEKENLGHGGKAAQPTEGIHDLTQNELPDTWAIEGLQFLCEPGRSITYGILKPGPDTPDGVPYIRVADFPNDRLSPQGVRRTTHRIAHEYRRSVLREGDVLLSIRGTVGRVCRVPSELAGANITQDTARISVHREMLAEYVEIYLRCRSVQKRFEGAMKGVAVRGVNIGDVRVLQIAVPPREEQDEIVRRVQTLLKMADAIDKRVAAATARAEKLTQVILAKAFRGELVPTEAELARREGRSYETASALLDRIAASATT